MATQPAEKKKARNEMGERGPNPAHILLDALSGAIKSCKKGGVSLDTIDTLVDMARQAYGTDQSTSWKMVAGSLREKTDAAEQEQSDRVAQSLTAATGTIPEP